MYIIFCINIYVFFFDETYVKIFQWAIKFNYQFLAIFQKFFWFMSQQYFGQISPPPN